MLPIWDGPIGFIQGRSQLLSAALSTALLRTVGVPALQEGTFIILPLNTLEVLPLNQLVSILAMTLAAAYIGLQYWVFRVLLVLLAPAVALLSNGIRIGMIGVFAERGWGTADLQSTHLFEGLVVAFVGYGVIFGCLQLFSLLERRQRGDPGIGAPTAGNRLGVTSVRLWPALVPLAILAAASVYSLTFRPDDIRLLRSLDQLPASIQSWTLSSTSLNGSKPLDFDVDDEITRVYQNAAGDRVRLYIGYHRYQREGKELTGNGANPLKSWDSLSRYRIEPGNFELNQAAATVGGRRRGFLFWYDINGRMLARDYAAKAYTLWDALTRRRTNGAVLAVGWEGATDADFEKSRRSAVAFVEALVPLLPHYIPS
jgi:EpsI family protein